MRLRAPGVGAPLEHSGGKGGGDARLVVGIVGFGGDFVVGIALGGRSRWRGRGRSCFRFREEECGRG